MLLLFLECSPVVNSEGMHPLHLASKHGHAEVARCVCLAGPALTPRMNKEGVGVGRIINRSVSSLAGNNSGHPKLKDDYML